MSVSPEVPPPGTVLAGKYLIEGVLGQGGMGVVLAARHQQLDQKVAIKLLLEEARKYPDVIERFSREARAAAKIQGEHVARVIDVGVLEDGAPYIVMEYLEGRDLSEELRIRGALPPADVVTWILEACEALAQAHAAKIVHRDLKPGNLFLARQPDGNAIVKVLDFGISKLVDPTTPALTKTSSLVGTPFYMAPEQLKASKAVDVRADIWALGVILYELIAGVPPFDGQSMPEIVAAILSNEPAPLESIRAGVPFGLETVIARCIQSRPDDRYQNIAELTAALDPFAASPDPARVQRIARVLGASVGRGTSLPVPSAGPVASTPRGPSTGAATVGADPIPRSVVGGNDKTVLLPDTAAAPPPPPTPPPGASAMATTQEAPRAASVTPDPASPAMTPREISARSIGGLTASSTLGGDKRGSKAIVVVAVALGIAAVGGGVFAFAGRKSHGDGVPLVSATPSAGATAEPLVQASSTPPAPLASTSSAAASATASSAASPSSAPNDAASATPVATNAPKGNAKKPPGKPSTSSPNAPTKPDPTPAQPTASPKNPLDMGIK